MKNELIRKELRLHGLCLWQLADLLHIHESTLIRHMRKELPAEERKRIIALIREEGAKNE